MYQFLRFNHPIPSCEIYALEFDKNSNSSSPWTFIYAINTPKELNNNEDLNLIIYGYISDLWIKEKDYVHPESINIRINSLDEYLNYLELQYKTDNLYREEWIKNNPDATPNTICLENKNYNNNDLKKLNIHFISSIFSMDNENNTTIFTGI